MPTFACNNCNAEYKKWSGRCTQCDSWNTVEETLAETPKNVKRAPKLKTEKVSTKISAKPRMAISDAALSEFFDGGLVTNSSILIAGEPGMGKSTLLLQLLDKIDTDSLYISAEEDIAQIAERATRLELELSKCELTSTTQLESIIAALNKSNYGIAIIDSIQTIHSTELQAAYGSVKQITHCLQRLVEAAKRSKTTLIIVGHVTKDGSIAGPKFIEHMVDTVINFTRNKQDDSRMLSMQKNRFGPTDNYVLYDMTIAGLKTVKDPTKRVIENLSSSDGSVIFPSLTGSIVSLTEVQALAVKNSYGNPRRTISGLPVNKLLIVLATLSKRANINVDEYDIFVNFDGVISSQDNAVDLAIALAVYSSLKQINISKTVVFGGLGLGGNIKKAPRAEARLKESKKHGFTKSVYRKDSALVLSDVLKQLK